MKRLVLATFAAVLAGATSAHEGHKAPSPGRKVSSEQHAWGKEGDPSKAVRTIAVDMADTMRFSPSELRIKRGETVNFIVTNSGKLMHEMVIGTKQELEKHAELMRKHPGMEHDEPYMAHVKPGSKERLSWTFNKAGTFMYGCLIPGHWESGMKGTIVVASK
jgi:uncharacterized cupredoxin-like copper-binding protein